MKIRGVEIDQASQEKMWWLNGKDDAQTLSSEAETAAEIANDVRCFTNFVL